MTGTPASFTVLDSRQLERIQSVHRGFLYQHLYAAACLLRAGSSARAILWPRRPTSNAKLLPLGHRRSPSLPEPPRLGPGISLESASPDALQSADPRIRTIIALR